MKKSTLIAAVALGMLPAAAWATGVLAISTVSAAPATLSGPGTLTVTATCVQGAGKVKNMGAGSHYDGGD
jgi:hypothetical protein